ncbi:glycosyltransferase family 2 protein [Dialister succinatiphilus]|uniref:glycosyltransferase family 2 protein n=1 Tax=Dialister succinatiphilus TaxID=487173 RepID=UPI0040286524
MENMDFYNIPIFIISYNRKETLKLCIERFQKDGYKNLIILDNASTDESTLAYLKDLSYKVIFFKKNYGHHVLWDCGLFNDIIKNKYYVLTDPDVLPIEECPSDYVEQFYRILEQHPEKTKVGFALKLDDLPENYKYKYDIIRFESFYWEKRMQYQFPIYDAPIDTTFALYKPGGVAVKNNFYNGIRSGYPYIARHLGWYVNNFSQADYYSNSVTQISTSLSDEAMNGFRCSVIGQLAIKQGKNLYEVMRLIYSPKFIRMHANWKSIIITIVYLLAKKIAVTLRLK